MENNDIIDKGDYMNDTLLKELINQLYDKPLGYEQRQFFIDRDNEFKKLQKIIDFQPQGVYGVCGETGVGKTSFLKQFMSEKIKSYFIPISEKVNKEMIISDLIFKLATLASTEKDKKLNPFPSIENTQKTSCDGMNGEIWKTSSETCFF